MPDIGIEVRARGFRSPQLLKDLLGNREVLVDGPVAEFQFQKDQLILISSRLQHGGVESDTLPGYSLRFGNVCGFAHTARG